MSKLIRAMAAAVMLLAVSVSASAQIGATTYYDFGTKTQRYFAFVVKDGNLYLNFWNGSQWKWANQGKPAGTTVVESPAVINYLDSATGKVWIYAFVKGADGNLYANFSGGSKWQWANQGKPPATAVGSAPRAVTHWKEGKNRVYVFVGDANEKFYVNYWDSTKWQWAELPKGGYGPGATTFVDPVTMKWRIYVFGIKGITEGGQTFTFNDWDGTKWQGSSHPPSPVMTGPLQHPAVISYKDAGKLGAYAFVNSWGAVTVYYWNGSKWQWANQGKPPGTEAWSDLSSITYPSSGKRWIHTFAVGKDKKLYVNFWDGTKWQWADYGKPPTAALKDSPTAITHRDAVTGKNQIYVFVMGEDGNLYANYGDSSNHKWANLGKL
jgi:hypothetical protein